MNRTPWNPDWSAAIARITTLVEAMFSCRAKFSSIEAFLDPNVRPNARLDFAEQDLAFLESTRFELPTMIRSHKAGKFAFPLRVRRTGAAETDVSLVGMATIEGLAASDDERLKQIAEFLHLAVETRLDAFERLLDIEQREQQLEVEQELRESSKVVSLFPRQIQKREEQDDIPAFQLPLAEQGLELTQPLLLLNEKMVRRNQTGMEKIAIEIFNRTSHWFFVNIRDLAEESFRNAASFRELGKMCVFIPNLAEISIEKQLRLAEVFSAVKGEADAPSFIAFVDEDPKSLISRGLVLPHLLDLMAMIHVPAALALSAGSQSPIIGHRALGLMMREISATLLGVGSQTGSPGAATVIPLMGKWNRDDSPNPTFH